MKPNNFLYRIITAVLLCIITIIKHGSCFAQSTIHGKVFNTKNEPAASASVLLLLSKDSSLIKAMVCDNNGAYAFSDIHDGSYLIQTSLLGYNLAYSNAITTNKA